jgi:hypothetical protein
MERAFGVTAGSSTRPGSSSAEPPAIPPIGAAFPLTFLLAWITIERTHRLSVVLVLTLLLAGFAPAREGRSAAPGPTTLAEIDTGTYSEGFVFAEGKLAWSTQAAPPGTPDACRSIRVLDLRTHRRDRLGACDDLGRPAVIGLADDGTAYSETYGPGNDERIWRFYENSASGVRLIVAYVEHDCATSPSCYAQLFVAGSKAFVIHAGTLFRVAGPRRLKPILDVPNGYFGGASWPLVALKVVQDAKSETRVYRLTDGKLIRTVDGAGTTAAVSSELLVQVDVGPPQTNISHVYDLASGRRLTVIRDESVLAVSGRRVVTSANRVLVLRIDGLHPRMLASTRGDVVSATLQRNRLLWIEELSAFPFRYRLRALDLR